MDCCFKILHRRRKCIGRRVLRAIVLLVLLDSLGARRLKASEQKNAKLDEEFTELASEAATKQMLNVLGMDELPKPRHNIVPHQYMLQIYEKMSRRKPAQNGVNTIRGFVDVGVHDDRRSRKKFHQFYAFNISALPLTEKLLSADLRLLRVSKGREWRYAWSHGTKYRAKLYHRKPVHHFWNGQIYTHAQLVLLDSILFDIKDRDSDDWKVFNVLDALRLWQNDSNFVHKFELQIESVRTGYLMPSYAFGWGEMGRPHFKRALLVSFADDGKQEGTETSKMKRKAKKKRRIMESEEQESTNRIKRGAKRRKRRRPLCNRKKLYVDFTLLNWSEWIIAPRGYNAYFCQGVCKYPIPEHLNPTNHAMVQTTVHSANRQKVPPACCVPDKLSGLSMLFLDKGDSIVYRKYDKMIVETCGCK